MNCRPNQSGLSKPSAHYSRRSRGFSMLELLTVIAIAMILAASAIPIINNVQKTLRLNASVSAITGAIQSTRYRAIFDGCPYQITINKDAATYQLSSEVSGGNTCNAAFANVGTAIPYGNPNLIKLNQNLVYQFSPGGSVTVVTGTNSSTITHQGTSTTKTIQVTKYGSITVQ